MKKVFIGIATFIAFIILGSCNQDTRQYLQIQFEGKNIYGEECRFLHTDSQKNPKDGLLFTRPTIERADSIVLKLGQWSLDPADSNLYQSEGEIFLDGKVFGSILVVKKGRGMVVMHVFPHMLYGVLSNQFYLRSNIEGKAKRTLEKTFFLK